MTKRVIVQIAIATAVAISLAMPAFAEDVHHERESKEADIPQCSHKLGALAVEEPKHNWWSENNLGSPEALIKMFVMRSHCFTLVDRGAGLDAAERERNLSSGGQLRQGSNVGKGQIKAADYVMVPDLVSQNSNSSGNSLGSALGGLIGGRFGAVVGGIDIRSKTADVLLTVTDVRSTEQVAMEEGHANKTDLGWGASGGVFGGWGGWGAAGLSGYQNTEIGQVVTLAYLDAYTKLVDQLGGISDNASQANDEQAVTLTRAANMYTSSKGTGKLVRKLEKGMMLYPTGEKEGTMWEVKDELGNQGWVTSLAFELSK